MRTSGEIDFRFGLKLKITLVESTYPSQRPECPSLSPYFLLDLSIITVADPLSADLIIMSCLCLSCRNASRSVLGRLSHTRLGLEVKTSNVIYMIQCTKCNLQYIGETKRRLKDRFNEHRRPIINPFCSYTHTAVSRHFLTSGHAEDHLILIPLEQLHTSRDSIRKAREAFLIHRGKTLEPAGLNRRDEM